MKYITTLSLLAALYFIVSYSEIIQAKGTLSSHSINYTPISGVNHDGKFNNNSKEKLDFCQWEESNSNKSALGYDFYYNSLDKNGKLIRNKLKAEMSDLGKAVVS